MTTQAKGKSKFSADERAKMITLAWIAGAAVSVADKEGGDKADAMEAAKLRDAVARCFTVYQTQTDENLSGEPSAFDYDTAESKLASAADEVLAMLAERDTPTNIDHYKTAVLDVAYAVAAAHAPGFMGRGEKVSSIESAALDKVAAALKAGPLLQAVKTAAETKIDPKKVGK